MLGQAKAQYAAAAPDSYSILLCVWDVVVSVVVADIHIITIVSEVLRFEIYRGHLGGKKSYF